MTSKVEAMHKLPSFDEQTTNNMIERINLEGDGRNGEYGSFVGEQLRQLRNLPRGDNMADNAHEDAQAPTDTENEPIQVTERTRTETKDNSGSPPTESTNNLHERPPRDNNESTAQRTEIKTEPPPRNVPEEPPLQDPRILVAEMTKEIPSVPKLNISDATIKRLEEIWTAKPDEEDYLSNFEQAFAAQSEASSKNDSMDIEDSLSPTKKQQSPALAKIRLKIVQPDPSSKATNGMVVDEDDVSFDEDDGDDTSMLEEVVRPVETKLEVAPVKVTLRTPPRHVPLHEPKREDTRKRGPSPRNMHMEREAEIDDMDVVRKSPKRRPGDRLSRVKQEQPKKRQPKVNQVIKEIGVPPAKITVSEAPIQRKRSLSRNSLSPERSSKRQRTTSPRRHSSREKSKTPSPVDPVDESEDTYDPFSAKPRHEVKREPKPKPVKSRVPLTEADLKKAADFWKHKADGELRDKKPAKFVVTSYLFAIMKYIELFHLQAANRQKAEDNFRSLGALVKYAADLARKGNLPKHSALAHLLGSFAYCKSFLLRRDLLASIDENLTKMSEPHKENLTNGCSDVLRMLASWDKAKRMYLILPVDHPFSMTLPLLKEFVDRELDDLMSQNWDDTTTKR